MRSTIKIVILLFFICTSMSGASFPDMEKYMRQHALIWEQLPMQWNEGAFLGNGLVGMMVYADSTLNALVFHLGRPDVTDHRKAPYRKTSIGTEEADKMVDFCRLDVGKMLLFPEGKILSGTFYLDIYNAELTGHLKTDKGDLTFHAYTPQPEEVNIVEVSSGVPYRWKGIPGNPCSPRIRVFPHLKEKLKYKDNPAPVVNQKDKEGSWVQSLLAGGDYATYWKEVPGGKSRSVLYVSTANEVPASSLSLAKAMKTVEATQITGTKLLKQKTRQWWNAYHERSFLSIPDKKLENFYFIQMYKLATCSHPDGPAMDVMGTFFKLSPWPSFWWNLNIQLTYMPIGPANRMDQGKNFQRLMDEVFPSLVRSIEPCKIGDYTWALQNYYMYLRYAGADWQDIKQQVVPKALDAFAVFDKILCYKENTWHLTHIESPEYEGFQKYNDSNYGLASLSWLLQTLIACHDRTSSTHPDYARWKEILTRLAPYPTNENGLMIAANKPLEKSHRHYSHLLAFYPFRLLHPDVPENRKFLEKSIEHWLSLEDGKGLAGYSYTGAASLYAYLGNGNKAYERLAHFINKPIGISILLPNTFYVESQGKNPVIETPLSAAASLTELLIQSWDETIRIFPAVPDHWKDCAFHALRAEGGFTVSAQRQDGRTEWVSLTSEKGQPCRIQLSGWDAVHQLSAGRTVSIKPLGNETYELDLKTGESVTLAPDKSTKCKLRLIRAKNKSQSNFYGVKSRKGLPEIMEWPELTPIKERVNVQADSARIRQIVDGCWVAVGTNKSHAIQLDYSRPFQGQPSYRFELKQDDNTLEGYSKGETKGRAELCYCYAVSDDFKNYPADEYPNAQKMKTVYHYGKGSCPQGSSMSYTFSVYIPHTLDKNVSTIFAQWHGMPSRTLVSDPDGKVMRLSTKEFLELERRMIFKKNTAYDKIIKINAQGDTLYRAGKPNGWLIEQGGYPPLAFGFSQGYFYIKANSDRKWLTDKTDRCNANPDKAEIMHPVTSTFKTSTIAYKMPFENFPKDCWITFQVNIDWTEYGKEKETILKPGLLDVTMSYRQSEKEVKEHIVNNEEILIGRNDEEGYYFKFGIYRVGNSTIPVCYNLAGYKEQFRKVTTRITQF